MYIVMNMSSFFFFEKLSLLPTVLYWLSREGGVGGGSVVACS